MQRTVNTTPAKISFIVQSPQLCHHRFDDERPNTAESTANTPSPAKIPMIGSAEPIAFAIGPPITNIAKNETRSIVPLDMVCSSSPLNHFFEALSRSN